MNRGSHLSFQRNTVTPPSRLSYRRIDIRRDTIDDGVHDHPAIECKYPRAARRTVDTHRYVLTGIERRAGMDAKIMGGNATTRLETEAQLRFLKRIERERERD